MALMLPALLKEREWTHQALGWNWGWNAKLKLWKNWHNTECCKPKKYEFPSSNEDVIRVFEDARRNNEQVRIVGAGCSPNGLVYCEDRLVFTDRMNALVYIDKTNCIIRIQSGVSINQLNEVLAANGLAMPVLTSISDPTIGGALATAIHGTGLRYGCLSTYVIALQLITAHGDILECSNDKNKHIFKAALCNMGALGMITEVTIKVDKAYKLKAVNRQISLNDVLDGLRSKLEKNQYYKFCYIPHTLMCTEWCANRVGMEVKNIKRSWWAITEYQLFTDCFEVALLISKYIPSLNKYINRLYAYLERGEWTILNRHDKVFNINCLFRQHVNEWCIPIENCRKAMAAIQEMLIAHPQWGVHPPIEVRFSDEDDIWLSPAYGQRVCWIGIIMYRPYNVEPPPYWRDYFKAFEAIMKSLDGRPHWAKHFDLTYNELKDMYPQWENWVKLRNQLDPSNMFVNKFLQKLIVTA